MTKSFNDISGKRTNEVLQSDYDRAEKFDNLYVGDIGVYYRDGFRIKHIPYDSMERVFLRVQEVNGRLCCGTATFAYYRVVFVCGGKEISDDISENESAYFAAFEKIKEKAPGLQFGVEEKEENG